MRKKIFLVLSFVCLFLFASSTGFPSPEKCDALIGSEKAIADKIMSTSYPYDCCDKTIDKCLKEKKVCKLAVRLAGEICLRVSKGESEDDIKTALSRRAKSMMAAGKKYEIDTTVFDTWIGDEDSKVTLVAYMCGRCPFCAKMTPKLYTAITKGNLKGKVKLHIRIFPIKGHKGGVEAGMAMAAAAKMGKFWPYILKLYNDFDSFAIEKLVPWAKEKGLDKEKFEKYMKDKELKKLVVDSKKEGLKNGVEGTPTFFINGRKYTADHKMKYFVDALLEEHDKVMGIEYVK